jgi:mRNA-degrading endonuclease RelE of RelBE toxin-antitoxin system
MTSKPKASIRKTRSGHWRGHIGDIRVIEFEDDGLLSS